MTKALFHLRQLRLLLLILLCALFSLPLSAQEAYVQQSTDQHTLTFYYDDNRESRSGTTWGINEKLKESPSISHPVWAGTNGFPNNVVTKVVFDASFKDFRPTTTEGWFYKLLALTTIEGLENLNTSEVTDMSAMFEGCSSLTSLNLSNFNTSAVTKMRGMFSGCYGLKELNVSNFNTSAVTDMSIMFSRCSSLTSLNLSNFNTSSVTDMSAMFYGCSSLKELNVSNFSTYIVKGMSRMFANCSSLKTILNTSTWQCEESQDMFKGCTQLKGAVKGAVKYDESRVDVTMANPTTGYFTDPNRKEAYVLQSEDQHTLTFYLDNNRRLRSGKTWYIDEQSGSSKPVWAGTDESPNNVVTKVVFDASFKYFPPRTTNSWFYNLKALTTIEGLQNLNTSSVTDMSSMFYGCSGLTSLNLSNLNTSAVKNMSAMFANCSGLKTIFNTNTWRCEKSKDMFKGCTQLRGAVKYDESKVNVTMANPTTGYFTDTREAYVLQSEDQHTITFYYDNNRKLRSGNTWDIDEKSSSSKPVWAGILHSRNKVVTKVVFDASFKDFRPTTTEGWFYNLSELTTIEDLQNLNTSKVTDMSSMFEGCWSLTSLNVSNFNTSAVTNMMDMFGDCSSLTSLNVSNFNTSAVTNMRDMFAGCTSLTELNVSNFNTSAVTNMSRMFFRCFGLTSLNLSNFNTSKVTDMGRMFERCSGLTSLNLSNFNTSAVTDMSSMFEGCSGLQLLYVSSFNTSKVTDMSDMFRDCSGVTSLNVSNFNTSSVTSMWRLFYGCSSLTSLNLSNFNTSAVTEMTQMFFGCRGLTELNVSNFNTSAVKDMNGMFSGCSRLKTILNPNTWRCERSQDMFKGCTQLNGAVKYDESKLDVTMANPTTGYFTDPNRKLEAYVLQSENQHTLTFYYDNNRKLRSGKTWDIDEKSSSSKPAWAGTNEHPNNVFTKVVFDASFKDFRPTTTNSWFYNLKALTTIEGLENLNTSAVTNMSDMFSGCSSLKTIFNTVTWRCEQSQDMFKGCTQLNGAVKYDASKLDVTMANPTTGYFTDPNRKLEAYVLQSENQHTLTFYYDNNRKLRSGKTWDIDQKSSSSKPAWAGTYSTSNKAVTKVVFDTSFKDFRPTTTEGWFYHLSELTTIEGLENLNTSAVTDMNTMFSGCSSLMSLNLSNFNTSAVTNMSEMFYGCSGLKELNVSNFNTSAVTDMSAMFFRCSSLKELNVSNFNTSAVKDMSGMFSGCSGLKELNVSNFNTSKVTSMNGMFSGCPGLKELNVSNFNTSAVTDMRSMFSNCSGLKELNVSNFNTSAVTDMRWMFFGCSGLKAILNLNTWRCERSQDMFKGCTQLNGALKFDGNKLDATMANPTTGYFTDTKESYVLQSEDQHTLTFYYDNNRKLRSSITWDIDENSSSSKPAWAGTYSTPNKTVTKVVFDASFKDFRPITTLEWFYYLSALTSIEGLENLNTSKVTDMRYMFEGCSGLTSLNLSNFNTSAVTDMGSMFEGCSSLTSLNLSNFSTSAVTDMGSMFEGCSSLTSLNLSNFNTSAVTDMSRMFYGCSRLTELNLSNFNTSAVTDMSSMFSGCSVLKELNVSNFNTSAVTDMSAMFKNCSVLKELNLSNFSTSKVTSMSSMFSGCSGLTSLNVSNFNTSKVTDMRGMFTNCSGLKTILNLNTWRCERSQDMFKGCTQLNGAVKYDESKLDVTMANPTTGYFTDPNRKLEAYVLQSKDQHTLTFYYDYNRKLHSGKTWDIDEKSSSSKPTWAGTDYTSNKAVTKVVFDASFKDFSPTTTEGWFYHLSELTTIEGLENLNTSAVTDMSTMFSGCSGLTSLNLSNFNTSAVTNMSEMFYGCSSLKTIFNTVTWRCEQSQDMFKGCTQLNGAVKYDASKLDVTMANPTTGYFTDPNRKLEAYVLQSENQHTLTFYYDNNRKLRSGKTWDIDQKSSSSKPAWAGTYSTSNKVVTKVVFDASFKDFSPTTTEGWFYNLSTLTTIEGLENLNTSEVTNMSKMFDGCSSLTSLNLSNFNTSSVTNMSEMFSGCSGLTSLNVFKFNTSSVTNMSEMFSGCSGLTSLNVSKFNTSAVTNMSGMFTNCSGLKTILNPHTWRCEKSQDMFKGCTQLNGAVKYDASKLDVTMANPSTGYFRDPNKKYLEAYVLQGEDQHTLTFYYDYNRKLRSGKTWDIDEKSSSSEPVWAGKEEHPNNVVTKIVFDASFKDFRPTTTRSWFYYLSELTTIEGLENLNTSAVTNMRYMFEGCSRLTELNVSNFNTSAVTNMQGMFFNCSRLTELNVSNFNTSKVTNMQGMFYRCSRLTELNVSNFNTSKVTNMEGMFYGCSGLTSLNVSNFNTSAVTNMDGMFEGCSSLTSINVSNFNTSKVAYMMEMFSGCSSLTFLNLSNFNTSKVTIMRRMFSGCSGLKTILNTDIWRCEESDDMFKGCTQLKGAVKYDASKLDVTMANPTTGYFSRKLPTAIGRVVFDDNNATQIYNLQGKRVDANQRHLPAGFYIVNGKKVYLNEKP